MSKSGLHGAQTSPSYRARLEETQQRQQEGRRLIAGLKPKDLIGIPYMLAFALRSAGWYWRQDIIAAKRAPMPESVQDRCTRAHEVVLMFSKRERYFYDAAAVREPSISTHSSGNGYARAYRQSVGGTRNRRDVWDYGCEQFSGEHYAAFPQALVAPMVLAGTSDYGVCSGCGAPWMRQSERTGHVNRREPAHVPRNAPTKTDSTGWAPVSRPTDQWQPTCTCAATVVPATVLDPFLGSGTTAVVALKHGRSCVGIELNPKYCEMAKQRLAGVTLPLPLVTATDTAESWR